MKRFAVVLAVAMMAASCFGQDHDAAKRAKVEDLMTAMHVDTMMDQMMSMAKAQIAQSEDGLPEVQEMTPQQKKIYDDFQAKSLELVTQSVSWKAIEPDMVTLYTKTFSEQEIDGITAFYKSPTGQALLTKTPTLMSGIMQFMQGRIAEMQPKIKALTDQFAKDMAAAGAKQSTS